MPLSLEIVSGYAVLVQAGLRLFRGTPGLVRVADVPGMPSEIALRCSPGCEGEVRAIFRQLLSLLGLEVQQDASLPPDTARLLLGTSEKEPFESVSLHLKCNETSLGEELEQELHGLLGSPLQKVSIVPVRRSDLLFGGAGRFCRRALQFLLLSRGVEVWPHREWPASDMDVFLSVCAPDIAVRPVIEHNPISVYTDDPDLASSVLQELSRKGIRLRMLPMTALPRQEASSVIPTTSGVREDRFCAALDSLGRDYEEQAAQILEMTRSALQATGVDLEQMPLEQAGREELWPSLVLPMEAFRAGRLRPYGTRSPGRFRLRLIGAPCAELTSLALRLEGLGFESVEVVPPAGLHAGRRRGRRAPEPLLMPQILWPTPAPSEAIKANLREALLGELRLASKEPLSLEEREEGALDTIRVDLPIAALKELGPEELMRRLTASLEVRIFSSDRASARALEDELRARGFEQIFHESRPGRSREGIFYGRAPAALMRGLGAWIESRFSVELQLHQIWGSHDSDVHIWLPGTLARTEAEEARSPVVALADLEPWMHGATQPSPGPFLERKGSWLHVGQLRLARPMLDAHPMTPSLTSMGHYVLDATTAATVSLLASASQIREPCLLEGETCTSKTSAILFLAAQLGQPVIRLNLNGQTDTSELVGRYVPGEEASAWCWQDGLVVEAMTRGYWLILDELNLAEPQVLERLNPVLEHEPSLTLTEGDGRVLRGDKVHPNFRVFATMNPTSYAGRSPLSPAMRDRFRAYRRVPPPTEQDVLVFLRALVLGAGSPISVGGRSYQPAAATCLYPALRRSPLMIEALPALARFHASAASAFREASGPGPRERMVFTRRALLSLLDFMQHEEVSTSRLREALVRYYLGRVEDIPAMIRLLDASGLGPSTWSLDAYPSQGSQSEEPQA